MAYKIIRERNSVWQDGKEIVAVLDAADLTGLGTDFAPGSTAIIADSGSTTYMLNASGEWKEI